MRPFRFRAAAILDLRAREERDAGAALALAEAGLRGARAGLEAAEARRRAAQDELAALERRGTDLATLLWHRNWIVRLAEDVARLGRDVNEHARRVQDAEQLWRDARRRRLALERWRDRARTRFERDERDREQKAVDELARIRYVMPEIWRSDS